MQVLIGQTQLRIPPCCENYIKTSLSWVNTASLLPFSSLYIMQSKTTSPVVKNVTRQGLTKNIPAPTNTSQLFTALSARKPSTGNHTKSYANATSRPKTSKKSGRHPVLIHLQDPHTGPHQLKKVVANAVRYSHSTTYKDSNKQDVFVSIPFGQVTSAATNEGNAAILAAKRDGNLKAVMAHFHTMKRHGAVLTHHTYNMILDACASLRREGSPIAGLLEGEHMQSSLCTFLYFLCPSNGF